ncbi:MAG: hypothetical protein ABI569_08940 [Casimicrobiaceae bacterium]
MNRRVPNPALFARLMDAPAFKERAVPVLREIREQNALPFDFVLKRSLASGGARFPRGVFETQPFFFDPT